MFWNRPNEVVQGPQGEREVGKPFNPYYDDPFQRDEVVRPHLDGAIAEVRKFGKEESVFRFGGLEFQTLRGAVLAYLDSLQTPPIFSGTKNETRQKTRKELAQEISTVLSFFEHRLIDKLAEVLQRPGDWRTVPITDNDYLKQKSEVEALTDLKGRLQEVFGDDKVLFLFHLVMPKIFDQALQILPEGQTEEDLKREEIERQERDRKNHARKLQAARDFLKKLNHS